MAKAPKWGVNTYKRDKPRKRPGRHKKNRNKHEKRMGKYRGKRGWQVSYINLYIEKERTWDINLKSMKMAKKSKIKKQCLLRSCLNL